MHNTMSGKEKPTTNGTELFAGIKAYPPPESWFIAIGGLPKILHSENKLSGFELSVSNIPVNKTLFPDPQDVARVITAKNTENTIRFVDEETRGYANFGSGIFVETTCKNPLFIEHIKQQLHLIFNGKTLDGAETPEPANRPGVIDLNNSFMFIQISKEDDERTIFKLIHIRREDLERQIQTQFQQSGISVIK
jgi:hypothetical protein